MSRPSLQRQSTSRLIRLLGIFAAGIICISAAIVPAAADPAERQSKVDAPPTAKSITGTWQGLLKVGVIDLRVVFHISADEQGQLKATMDSPDQGAKGLSVDSVTLSGDELKLLSKQVQGDFTGKLSADGQTVVGKWTQLGSSVPLTLKRPDKDERPQTPKRPYPYTEVDAKFENTAAGVKLAGTLTLPKAESPVPAVVLISGSGAQDRDESLMDHKPFLVLADYLTRRGIAVLRVDDRGVGGSTGDTTTSTTEDLTGDVLAAVNYLKTRKEIDPRRIGLIGHSEGGMIAPLAASRSKDIAFIVLLAGTGVTGEEILYRQGELIVAALGSKQEAITSARATQEKIFKIVKQEPDVAQAEAQIRRVLAEVADASAASLPKETVETQIKAQVQSVLSPWFRFFLTYDPAPTLRKVRCPVLALNGEKDLQVDPKQNLPPIEEALKAGGNTDITVKELPGLNHLFQHCKTGSPAEYRAIQETFSPEALELVAAWIRERTR